jgi:hypothetical protein
MSIGLQQQQQQQKGDEQGMQKVMQLETPDACRKACALLLRRYVAGKP